MNKLYHITTGNHFENVKVGDFIESTNLNNKFFKGVIDSCTPHASEKELIKKSNEIHSKYDDLNELYSMEGQEKIDALQIKSAEFHGLSTSLNNSLFKYLSFIQEEIFEKIRSKHFPNKPSWKKCIWLCSEKSLHQWWSDIGKTESKIIEVELSSNSNLFLADSELIKTETFSIEEIEQMAIKYWKGLDKDYQYGEFVLEGKLKVSSIFQSIDEIKMSNKHII